jgi:short-subunit dehydrogenase
VELAGVNHRGPVRERKAAELAAVLETNLAAPIRLTQASLPLLERGGVVVNVASLSGKIAVPFQATYCASKAGLVAFGRSIAFELANSGVRVATISPGPVDTGFFGDLSKVPDLVFSQPMSSAEDVASVVVRAIESNDTEIDIPRLSGRLALLGYVSPAIYAALRPMFERLGARNKARFFAQRESARASRAERAGVE